MIFSAAADASVECDRDEEVACWTELSSDKFRFWHTVKGDKNREEVRKAKQDLMTELVGSKAAN